MREAEGRARRRAAEADKTTGTSTVLVLTDRPLVIKAQLAQAYPVTRNRRITSSGRGYSDGHAQGQRASIGPGRGGGG